MNYKVVIQQDEDGRFNASCPELRGCHTFGNTIDDALNNIREAIELYLEDIPNEDIGRIRTRVEFLEVAV